MLAQLRVDDLANLLGQTGQPARGQFLAADFEQQLAIHLGRRSRRGALLG
ncbi:MAG: hypothetical protein JF601_04315 [Acidobacteria bacterium]|nr:hypothetical protein [Acidobacteriota bacterium]